MSDWVASVRRKLATDVPQHVVVADLALCTYCQRFLRPGEEALRSRGWLYHEECYLTERQW